LSRRVFKLVKESWPTRQRLFEKPLHLFEKALSNFYQLGKTINLKRQYDCSADSVLLYTRVVEIVHAPYIIHTNGIEDIFNSDTCFHVRSSAHLMRAFREKEQSFFMLAWIVFICQVAP
jgi:hypothetical protein